MNRDQQSTCESINGFAIDGNVMPSEQFYTGLVRRGQQMSSEDRGPTIEELSKEQASLYEEFKSGSITREQYLKDWQMLEDQIKELKLSRKRKEVPHE